MFFKPAFIAAFLAAAALAAPAGYVVHEKRSNPPRQWQKREAVAEDHLLAFRIGMNQPLEQGEALLYEVSDHNSPRYGQWYSPEEIIDIFAPPQKAVDDIRNWLLATGIAEHRIGQSTNKQWMQMDITVGEANKLFNTKYHWYENSYGAKNVATDEYHLPASISKHVDYITPGLKLHSTSKKAPGSGRLERRGFRTSDSTTFSEPLLTKFNGLLSSLTAPGLAGVPDTCSTAVTPACIATMYNITTGTKSAAGNQLGIFEEGDYLIESDLATFLETFEATRITPATKAFPKVEGIDGGTIPEPDNAATFQGAESDLDFQISIPIIYPQGTILFQTDDYAYATGLNPNNDGAFNTFLDALDGSYCKSCYTNSAGQKECGDYPGLDPTYPDNYNVSGVPAPSSIAYQGKLQCGVYKPTNVISVSYGLQEDDLPTLYLQRQCAEYMKLGMQGVSVVFASGDSGVSARSTDDNNADGCLGTGQVFNPDYPASCPYVTAVGATTLTGAAQGDNEQSVTQFPSGGGFSNIWTQPSYQKNAVNTFLAFEAKNTSYPRYQLRTPTNNPTKAQYGKGIFNSVGRGYPDVSAIGQNVVIIYSGTPQLIGGTSAAAPVFAAVLTRINEERLAAGKKTVGFVNPVLYAHPTAFHDITVGNNSGCGTAGFYATKGWDPLTGLGTPNYPSLLKVFMGLS